MVFSSLHFIGIFLPIALFLYAAAGEKYRRYFLLAISLVFYGLGEPYYIPVLLLSLVANFFLSGRMEKRKQDTKRKKWILCGILLWNFGILFFFKYVDFIIENVNQLLRGGKLPLLHLALPLGISFYTFQIVSYQVDLYRGGQKRCESFWDFALYVCMFPQLIAGPIVRFGEVETYIRKPAFCLENMEEGAKLFTAGLGLKALLANQIGTLFQTVQSVGAESMDITVAWLGAAAYTFQIYFDFWGYSLMAIGLGLMLGYRLPGNFNQPYCSKSVTEFWRRWHITLSAWFREYVYIPLGGNRKGRIRTACNLLIVWSLTGLWHGASWNFILWGLFFYALLMLEKSGLGEWLEKTKVIGHLYCILVIPVSWIIFSQTSLTGLSAYLKAMLGWNEAMALTGTVQVSRYLKEYGLLLLACVFCSTPIPQRLFEKYKKHPAMLIFFGLLFWVSIYELYIGKNNPFLYFRF